MASNVCTVCVSRKWPEEERGPVVGTCTVCDEGSCEWHGQEYRNGFEHSTCHEAPDFTRAEDGSY